MRAQYECGINFFLGFHVQGVYVDDLSAIAHRYATSPTRFWFDLSTSIPFGWIDYAVYLVRRSASLYIIFVEDAQDGISSLKMAVFSHRCALL